MEQITHDKILAHGWRQNHSSGGYVFHGEKYFWLLEKNRLDDDDPTFFCIDRVVNTENDTGVSWQVYYGEIMNDSGMLTIMEFLNIKP